MEEELFFINREKLEKWIENPHTPFEKIVRIGSQTQLCGVFSSLKNFRNNNDKKEEFLDDLEKILEKIEQIERKNREIKRRVSRLTP